MGTTTPASSRGGGRLPDDFETTGYAILNQYDVDWIFGKDDSDANKAIEIFAGGLSSN